MPARRCRLAGPPGITRGFPRLCPAWGLVAVALLTLAPRPLRSVRLACLIHAANVHSEPGSNPSKKAFPRRADRKTGPREKGPSKRLFEENCQMVALGAAGRRRLVRRDRSPRPARRPRDRPGRVPIVDADRDGRVPSGPWVERCDARRPPSRVTCWLAECSSVHRIVKERPRRDGADRAASF